MDRYVYVYVVDRYVYVYVVDRYAMVEVTADGGGWRAWEATVRSTEQATVTGRLFVVMDLWKSIFPVV